VLTWQTGYPMAVDFSSGVPVYQPARRATDCQLGIRCCARARDDADDAGAR
jgi:formylmethanofuran dehydrogenase subunit B